MVLCSATSTFRSEWQTYVGSVRVRWRGAMGLAQSVRIQTPCIDLNWMLLECIRKSRTIRKSWTHRTWNRNRARQEPQWELQKEQTLESNCCDPQQTNWPHPQTNCAQSATQSGCSPAPLHSAGYLLVMLVYKYRNNHLKILLKLFYNLRLFDARHPAMQFCSVLFSSLLFGEVQFCSVLRCRLGFGLACFCFSFRTKYVQIPLQSHIILFILWKEFSECNNKRLRECRQRQQQQQQQLQFELSPDSLSSYPGDVDAPTCFSVGSTERNALLFRALCLSLNLQVVYTRNWPKLFTNVANVHNVQQQWNVNVP